MTDKNLQDALVSLTASATDAKGKKIPLPSRTTRAAIPAAAGVGKKAADQQVPAGTGGGGITSPLTETTATTRTYHTEVTKTSPDGVIKIKIRPIASFNTVDGASNPLVINLAAPVP